MKKSARCLAFLLTVVMLLGTFAVTSFAEGETADVTIKTNTDTAVAGDVITVTVNVANNYYATSMRWPVLFSSAFFELVEGSAGATETLKILGGTEKCTETPDNTIYTTSYSSEEYTGVLFQWTAGVSYNSVKPYNMPSGMDCFTFKLKVRADVEIGDEGKIVVPEDYPRFYNYILTDMEEPFTPDKVVQCENLVHNFTNAAVTCTKAEILPVDEEKVAVDQENKIIRGIPVNAPGDISDYVYATVGEIETELSPEGRIGTGTKVKLVAGDKVEEYTVIIAGDLNGDGLVDYTDLILLDWYEKYEVELDEYKLLASELTGDGTVDANDKVDLDMYLNFEGTIDQKSGIMVSY